MSSDNARTQTWIDIAIATGLVGGIFYGAPNLPFVRGRLHDFMFMGFGPLLTVSAVGLYFFFRRYRETVSNQIAHGALFLAGLSFTHMATMQMSIFKLIPRYYQESSGTDRELWRTILKGVSPTQLGLDFAFDIFVSIGVILLALQMWWHPRFSKVYALIGALIAFTGLTFNFVTFPLNSGESGLVDPGPFFGVWMSLAVIQVWRCRRWRAEGG